MIHMWCSTWVHRDYTSIINYATRQIECYAQSIEFYTLHYNNNNQKKNVSLSPFWFFHLFSRECIHSKFNGCEYHNDNVWQVVKRHHINPQKRDEGEEGKKTHKKTIQ